MYSCFSRCLRVPIAMRRLYEQSLWIPQNFLFTILDLHHGLSAAKSGCAREWGGWGRISEDGSGQNNPNRNEAPWGRAGRPLERRCSNAPRPSTQNEEQDVPGEEHEGWRQTARREDLVVDGKAPSEIPALKP